VTGNSTSAILGQSVIHDDSVQQSAQNAAEAVLAWLWQRSGVELSRFHIHFQIRSILEGGPGQGVSGPSAGLAMVLALISELSGFVTPPSLVATGTIGIKLDVGPVGGLGGFGAQTGKMVGILRSRRVRITDLVLPAANFESAADEMRILTAEGIRVHAVSNVIQSLHAVFGVGPDEIVEKIKERFESPVLLAQTN